MEQPAKSGLRMFAGVATASDDGAVIKKIQTTHAPDGRVIDAKSVIDVIEGVMRHATPSIDFEVNDAFGDEATLDYSTSLASLDGTHETLASIIQKISCEMTCKCSGEDLHATTISIFNALSYYTWDEKMVITLAAFTVIYGEFWLVAQLSTANLLAKSVALFKQMPSILQHYDSLKPQFDMLNDLIKNMLDAIKCVIKFKELPTKYISSEAPPLPTALAQIPVIAYWMLRGITTCALQITNLITIKHEDVATLAEPWDLSSFAHKISSIHGQLKKQITLCYQHIAEKREKEAYNNVVQLFDTIQMDNMKVLRTFISTKDDLQPLMDGSTKTLANIEVLRKKHVLLLISNLDLSHEEAVNLRRFYKDSRTREENRYEVVWLPIIDKSALKDEDYERKLNQLQEMMSWYTVQHPSLIEPAVIRYIKEKWHFSEKPILVSLDPQGRVLCHNALHMLWIWGNLAFPFTSETEEALWKSETWTLELLLNSIDVTILELMKEGRFICLFGGEDIEWIRKFVRATKLMAEGTGISVEMVYVGKSNAMERVRKINKTIKEENLSYVLTDITSVWFFWERLESMLYSKLRLGKTAENDKVMQEIISILGYDGSHEQGWTIIGRETDMTRAKGNVALNTMLEYERWEEDADEKGIVQGFLGYVQQVQTAEHCNHLVLPGNSGEIPGKMVCADCGRTMEKFFMYRCCV